MKKLTEQKPACNCSLDDEHATALLEFLKYRGSLILDHGGYREMSFKGWTRTELKRAAAVLKHVGKITIDASSYGGTLQIELIEEESSQCPAA